MIIESVDRWPSDIPKPEWLGQVELLAEQEALALRKLGLPVYINWWFDKFGFWGDGVFHRCRASEDFWSRFTLPGRATIVYLQK